MVVLNVTFKCKPGMRDEFMEVIMAEGIDEACRNEEGNIKYDYYYPSCSCTDDDDTILLVERWRDAEALAEHGKQPHYLRFQDLKPIYTDEVILNKYFAD